MNIRVRRKCKTTDGLFGRLDLDESLFTAFTVERLLLAIAAGRYKVGYSYSPHFNRQMPHILVPGRTHVMFHWANAPSQLEGCVAMGDKEEPDAVDNSRVTFNKFDALIEGRDDVWVTITDEYDA